MPRAPEFWEIIPLYSELFKADEPNGNVIGGLLRRTTHTSVELGRHLV